MLRPLRDCVIVRPIVQDLSSIVWTPVNEESGLLGEVVAVGPGKRDPKTGALLQTCVREGQRVRYTKHVYPVADGFHVIQEGDVIGTVHG